MRISEIGFPLLCKAHKSNGKPCKAQAIRGGKVCRVHGGSAPQVVAAAMHRLLMLTDPAVARLGQILKSRLTEPKDAIVAIREILNRAGVHAAVDTGMGNDPGTGGQVLWDEFIQIHRRRAAPDSE